MNREEEVRMTHSGILVKDGKRRVSVRFERGADIAEALLPECKIINRSGFSEEEICGLEGYLQEQNDAIFAKAKEISNIKHWF